jgi:hypothetical protein
MEHNDIVENLLSRSRPRWKDNIKMDVRYTVCSKVWRSTEEVVVEFLHFGAMWICRLIPMFHRNMLSPSSGPKLTRQGSIGLI